MSRQTIASSALLAFSVSTDYAEAGVLAWATTRGKAKYAAMGSLWLAGSDWNDLRCKREPRADSSRTSPGAMNDSPTPDDCRLMRNLGWYEIGGPEQPCAKCGRYEWRDVIESTMMGTSDLCAECVAAKIDPLKKIREATGA